MNFKTQLLQHPQRLSIFLKCLCEIQEKETREPPTDTEKTSVQKQAEVESKKSGKNTSETQMASKSKPKSSKIKSSKSEKGKMVESVKPTPVKPPQISEVRNRNKDNIVILVLNLVAGGA